MGSEQATTTTASGAGFAEVGVARGTSFTETRVNLCLLPGLNAIHEVNFLLYDVVINKRCLVI